MEIGTINQVDINEQMRSAYLDYAMSVIVSRALPDARDGLKPVHRRILFAMHDMGIRPTGPFRKSARIVGEVLGKYHPHGDSSVYDAMVRMAQNFSMRYMLVDGQGNFGSIDGDSAAAMRYTEARLARIAMELLEDIEKNTIEFTSNFDDSLKEPTVLPARLPNLLLNGSTGIAVGMATNIPPHNLSELCEAIAYLIDHYEQMDDIALEDLMRFVKGPDFPTGGIIVGTEGIKSALATGRGRIIVRGLATIEDMPGKHDRQRINITELPYQVNKANLIERIAELANQDILPDISDLRDETGRQGLSIIVELKRNTQPMKVLNQLFKHTPLQTSYSVQVLALVDKQPRLLGLKRALQVYIDHRFEVITRRTQFELDKALRRQHILEGLLIALSYLDEVIATIRRASDVEEVCHNLIIGFGLSEAQAIAILDMQLRRLAALERQKIEDEHKEILVLAAYLQSLLDDPEKIRVLIKADVLELKEKYGDARRTQIALDQSADLSLEDLIQDEEMLVSITRRGYVKRTPISAYRLQGRGGRGLIGMGRRDEDELEHLFAAGTLHNILFFSDRGKVYVEKTHVIPELDRTARGTSLMNILPLLPEERITAALVVDDFEAAKYLVMVTERGRIKRCEVSSFANVRSTGLIAISLDEDDKLGYVKMTNGGQDLILVSEQGKGIRFSEEDVRPMGRAAAGVNAIRLDTWDHVAGFDVVTVDEDLLLLTEYGYGKRTSLDEYRTQGRFGQGVRAMRLLDKSGKIVSARAVSDEDELTVISVNGLVLRIPVNTISRQGRDSQGVRVMDLKDDDAVASVAILREERLAQLNEQNGVSPRPVPEQMIEANGAAANELDE